MTKEHKITKTKIKIKAEILKNKAHLKVYKNTSKK